MKLNKGLLLLLLSFINTSMAADKTTIRVGVLAFGTLAWELATLAQQHDLDKANFQLQTQTLASPQAAEVALQADAVDVILADWVWTARMRASGHKLSFYPYSTTSGALVVAANSPIKTLADLKGKRLGIAGGELDKNWLLLQALAHQQHWDLRATTTQVFAAPPLLNQQLATGRVDAVLNYWHFAARLQAQGYRSLLDGQDIIHGLGIKTSVPSLGYVFKQAWAETHSSALRQFLIQTQQAKNSLCTSDSAWQGIRSLTQAEDTATQTRLRERYCAGRVTAWGAAEQRAAAQIYPLLNQYSQLTTATSTTIPAGTFWTLATPTE